MKIQTKFGECDFTKFEDVTRFLGAVNRAIYGVDIPRAFIPQGDNYSDDDHDCHNDSYGMGHCSHESHKEV